MNIKESQIQICNKYQSKFEQLTPNEIVAVALDTIGQMPIVGKRVVLEKDENVSWFIYCGEYSAADDFYQPIHWHHLIEMLPEVLPYLALEQGFNFIIDNEGYEDIWKDDE